MRRLVSVLLLVLSLAPPLWAQPHAIVQPDRVVTGHAGGEFVPRFATFLPNSLTVTSTTPPLTGDLTYDAIEVADGATLRCTPPLILRVTHILVLPGGAYDCVGGGVTVVFRDVAIDRTVDPFAKGNGLVSFGKTRFGTFGPAVPAFVRIANAPAGANTLTVPSGVPATWNVGDELIVPDTRQMGPGNVHSGVPQAKPRREAKVTIASKTANIITLSKPLDFAHSAPVDVDGAVIQCQGAPCGPFAANATRGFVIQSENPAGTRGHIIVMGHSAPYELDGALLLDLGRTQARDMDTGTATAKGNTIGSYAFHAHHTVGFNSYIKNSAVLLRPEDNMRWGIAIHQTHDSVLENNVIVGAVGAGIALEDGPEQRTRIVGNLVAYSQGNGIGATENIIAPRNCGGCEGSGIWVSAPVTTLEGNVTVNNHIGVNLFFRARVATMVPSVPGGPYDRAFTAADYAAGSPRLTREIAASNYLAGVETWDLHIQPQPHAQGLYTVYNGGAGVILGPSDNAGFWARDFFAYQVPMGNYFGVGLTSNASYTNRVRIEGGEIRGFGVGIQDAADEITLKGLLLQNAINVDLRQRSRDLVTLDHVVHRPLAGRPLQFVRNGQGIDWTGVGPSTPVGTSPPHSAPWLPTIGSRLRIINWQGTGQDYRVFERQSLRSKPAWPATPDGYQGSYKWCPDAGITMGECWDRYGLAYGAAVVPDDTAVTLPGLIYSVALPGLTEDPLPPVRAILNTPNRHTPGELQNGKVRVYLSLSGDPALASRNVYLQVNGGAIVRVSPLTDPLQHTGPVDLAMSEGPQTVVTWRESLDGQRIEASRAEFAFVVGSGELPPPTPVDCVVSDWSEWGTCVEGTQTRLRAIITPPAHGGAECPVLVETRSCTVEPTPTPFDWRVYVESLRAQLAALLAEIDATLAEQPQEH